MSEIIPLIPVYDRSRTTKDWTCPRARFWQYEYLGRGIVKGTTSQALHMGTTVHSALAEIARCQQAGEPIDIDLIALAAQQQMKDSLLQAAAGEVEGVEFAFEQAALVEGMVRGFYKHIWPKLIAQYPKILHIEQEMEYHHDGLIFMSKPDLVVANDDSTVYIEFKTTGSKTDEWVNSWDTAVQIHSTIKAIEATTGTKVDSVIVIGLYKGFESYGKQSSPYCYAYRKAANPPFVKEELLYEYKAGFKRYPTWQLEGGTKHWVEGMPENVLANQFLMTPPIFVDDDQVETFFRQRAIREQAIASAVKLLNEPSKPDEDDALVDAPLMDFVFPQKFDQCKPGYGRQPPCEYRKLCFGHTDDPVKEGYNFRVSHHQLELERHKELYDTE